MSDISQSLKITERLPYSTQQKVIRSINVLLLIGLLVFMLDSARTAILVNSKLTGIYFAVFELIFICIPELVLFFFVFKNKRLLAKATTIFWIFATLILTIFMFFLTSTMLFNTIFNVNFFSLPKLLNF